MTRTPALASMVVVALMIGCGGGGSGDDIDAPPHPDGSTADGRPDGPPGGTPVTFTVITFDGQPEDGDVVLYSDNGGPWTPATAGATGEYHFNVVGPRYAIARGCHDVDIQYTEAWLYYLTLDDSTDVHDIGCHTSTTSVTVSGTLTGVGGNRGQISAGAGFTTLSAGATDYSLLQPPGTTDLVAKLYPNVPSTQPRPTQRLLIERDLVVPATDFTHDLDFTADGVAPETHTFTLAGGNPGDSSRVGVNLDSGQLFSYNLESTSVTTDDYHTLPAALMQAGDKLIVTRSSSDAVQSRSVSLTLDAAADVTGTLPAAYSPADPTITSTGPIQLAGTLPHVDGGDIYSVDALVVSDATFDFWYWNQSYTARYAAGQDIDYAFPNLIGIGGWTIELGAGEIDWDQFVRSSTATDIGIGFPTQSVVGDITTSAGTSGALTPP